MGASCSQQFDERVTVIGGGYAGASAAFQLSKNFAVTLVEPSDSFTHVVGAPRGIVQPGFEQRLRLDYTNTVGSRGRVVHARAENVEEGRVVLANGDVIESDFVVVAVGGSGYRAPLRNTDGSREEFMKGQQAAQKVIQDAQSIIVVGGGPTGLEIIGEIKHTYPDKRVILVHSRETILNQFEGNLSPKIFTSVTENLEALGVEVILGARLEDLPSEGAVLSTPGAEYSLSNGQKVTADALIVATGAKTGPSPAASLLSASALDANSQIRVNDHLEVHGLKNVFAIGDASARRDTNYKTAVAANEQAEYVAKEITARAGGKGHEAFNPATEQSLAITMGPKFGAGGKGRTVFPGFLIRMIKGKDMSIWFMSRGMGIKPHEV